MSVGSTSGRWGPLHVRRRVRNASACFTLVVHPLFRVLPVLQSGLIVHIHDILWPFVSAPSRLEQGRAWTEGHFVRIFLRFHNTFAILGCHLYMARERADLVAAAIPLAMPLQSTPKTAGNSSRRLRKN